MGLDPPPDGRAKSRTVLDRRLRRLITRLRDARWPHVFNPYRDRCEHFDRADAARQRRRNLEQVLQASLDQDVQSLWIGRDLGFRGGRRTGLAFTDEHHLSELETLLPGIGLRQATLGRPVAERTAKIIWHERLKHTQAILFWNVFPFHPHEPGVPLSNRAHNARERDAGIELLNDVIAIFQPSTMIGIGQCAGSALDRLGSTTHHTIRHPSFGGQRQFVNGVKTIYRDQR